MVPFPSTGMRSFENALPGGRHVTLKCIRPQTMLKEMIMTEMTSQEMEERMEQMMQRIQQLEEQVSDLDAILDYHVMYDGSHRPKQGVHLLRDY